ncbi:MAG: serpin family protein [Thermomicrobiales bacterium]|nr:serpin family protein [Thermomicrobiales bacterium]
MIANLHTRFDRRRLIQAGAVAFAAAQAPNWLKAAAETDAAVNALVLDNNLFALELYQEIRAANEGNLLISPYSVSLALAMTFAGAAGTTAEQMANAMNFAIDAGDLPAAFRDLTADLTERGTADDDPDEGQTARTLSVANAIWGEQTFPFNDDYLNVLSEEFGAALNLVDFKGDPEGARIEINDWIAEQTNDRIENIVPEGAITPDARLVLANAIWFYGAWLRDFNPEFTSDDEFTLLDGENVTVPFMHQQERFDYAQGEGYQALELPYAGSGFAFTLVMPDEGTFEEFDASFDADTMKRIVNEFEWTEIILSLPSFSFEFGASVADALKALGMTDAFDDGLADFSGMVGGETDERLFISDILHKAFIALDEAGTEAAAATVVIMEGASAAPSDPIQVDIDRPFLFAIRDTVTGAILFLGRLLSPEA